MRRVLGFVLLLGSSLGFAAPIRIMPLGDSITAGYPVPGGYRTRLYYLLSTEGFSFDFVGSMTDNSNFPALPDPDHEGHSGWQTVNISANISGWLTTSTPDVILLHIGTNDISAGVGSAVALSRLDILLSQITSQEPNAQLFVASVVPRWDSNEATSQVYNAGIPGLVSSYTSQGKHVYFVDIHSAVGASDLADGIHPNQGGYDKMANVWNGAIQSNVVVPEPATVTAIALGLGFFMNRRKRRR
ncbi:MAG: GDSL-type esterase/lipase family protein [Fimbriimonadales bacterium]